MKHVLEVTLKNVDSAVKAWFDKHDPYQYKSVPTLFNHEKVVPLCPICGAECKYEEDYMEHIKMEEHVTCPKYHYSYSFVAGSTETCVGSVVVHSHYSDSEEEREHQSRIINLALIHEREKWNEKEHQDSR